MNIIWTCLMLASVAILIVTNPSSVIQEMTSASFDVLSLMVNLMAVYTVWLGLFEIVEATGLGNKLAKILRPFIRWLFKINDEETEKYIALNMSSNILGLGNASTPMGIEAMKRLDKGNGKITPQMIMLLIVNATSIQFLPSTVIGLRTAVGSQNPTSIILPTFLATLVTCVMAICLTKLCEKIFFKNKVQKNVV